MPKQMKKAGKKPKRAGKKRRMRARSEGGNPGVNIDLLVGEIRSDVGHILDRLDHLPCKEHSDRIEEHERRFIRKLSRREAIALLGGLAGGATLIQLILNLLFG